MPNWGYETAGPSTDGEISTNGCEVTKFTSPADIDAVTSLSLYCRSLATCQFKGVIFNSSLQIVSNGVSAASSVLSGTFGWVTVAFSTPPTITPATVYYLGFVSSETINYGYTSGDADQMQYESDNNYTTPTNMSGATGYAQKDSIYVTYTTAGGSTAKCYSGLPCGLGLGMARHMTKPLK